MDDESEEKTSTQKVEWNDKLEKAAQGIGQAAQAYKHMHIWQAQRATKRHKYLMGSGIIVGPLASVLQSIALALNMENDPIFSVIVIVLGFLSGIIIATVKFGKYDEVSNANKSAAARYTSIEGNVRRQLGLYRRDRMPSIAYMDWLETKYEELLLSAPLLSAGIFNKYTKHAKTKGLPVPEQYDQLISINNVSRPLTDRSEIRVRIMDEDEEQEKTVLNPVLKPELKPVSRSVTRSTSTLKRSAVMARIPEMNCASDKMLEYEMHRLMGLR